MKVAFRVDASDRIGTGHVMRCLSLAHEMVSMGCSALFLSRSQQGDLRELITGQGFAVARLGASMPGSEPEPREPSPWLNVDWEVDLEQTRDALRELGPPQWLVVDHYGLDWRWESGMRGFAENVLVVDDLPERRHDCDLLLDQNLRSGGEASYEALLPTGCEQLLGPRFGLLRREFRKARDRLEPKQGGVNRILVSFGGIDAEDWTSKTLSAIQRVATLSVAVDVVVGARYPHRSRLAMLCERSPNTELHVQTDRIAKLMAAADMAVGAGGSSTWERCAVGLPTLAWPVARNQEELLREAGLSGAVYVITPEQAGHELETHIRALLGNDLLRERMRVCALALVDGLGARRVASAIGCEGVSVAPITWDDSRCVYEWRNHPDNRRHPLNAEEIAWQDHQKWFAAIMADRARAILIGRNESGPIGAVRLDVADSVAEISICLAPGRQSAELRRSLIAHAERWLRDEFPGVCTSTADVIGDNQRLHSLFLGARYEISQNSLREEAAPMNTRSTFTIGTREIGPLHRPFVIAEMSGNHNGSLDRALRIVEAAAAAGADAIKLQTYTADTMTLDIRRGEFMVSDPRSLWAGSSLYDLYQQAHTPWEWHEPLFRKARELGIAAFSSPFDATAVDFLEELGVPCYKIASFEIVDLPLIRCVAATGKPMIISTGMASLSEIAEAVDVARDSGCTDIALLKCTSTYPASPRNSNLRTIPSLRELFGTEVGLSDHTLGIGVALGAVALGATIVEKHFTLDRSDGGVDSAFSMEPGELRALIEESQRVWQAVGDVVYGPTDDEQASVIFRRSLYVVCDLEPGAELTTENLRAIRPGLGLPPRHLGDLLGKRIARSVARGTPASWDLFRTD